MGVIHIMWLRQLLRFWRSKARIAGSLGQPLLFLITFGFGLGRMYQSTGHGSAIMFLAPGVASMAVLFSSVFSGMELIWDRQFGFIKETLVAPVPRWLVMVGRTLGGATVAVTQGCLVLLVSLITGFRFSPLAIFPALLFMALIAIIFTAVGSCIASLMTDFQGFQTLMNVFVMPMFFLSGALFPLNDSPPVMKAIAAADPLSYGVDGLRAVLIHQQYYSLALDFAVLVGVSLLMLWVGSLLFNRIEV